MSIKQEEEEVEVRFTIGLLLGFLAGLTIYRAPYYAGAMMDRVPPETPAGHSPKMRNWVNGEEVWPAYDH
jgi:hypothetical protein